MYRIRIKSALHVSIPTHVHIDPRSLGMYTLTARDQGRAAQCACEWTRREDSAAQPAVARACQGRKVQGSCVRR